MSFNVIDVDSPENLVTSVGYNMQHVCAYLQPFYTGRANSGKKELLGGTPLLRPR